MHTIEPVEEEPSITTAQVEAANKETNVFDSQFGGFSEGFDFQQPSPKRDER